MCFLKVANRGAQRAAKKWEEGMAPPSSGKAPRKLLTSWREFARRHGLHFCSRKTHGTPAKAGPPRRRLHGVLQGDVPHRGGLDALCLGDVRALVLEDEVGDLHGPSHHALAVAVSDEVLDHPAQVPQLAALQLLVK